jgi:glyoxylase-like metal-dependent hydrolase (beta-lactamase superfamily II)
MSELHYETLLIRREGLTRDLPAGNSEDLRWVANSATLIYGDHGAVLVDTFLTIEQNERLVDWVKGHGRRLTHIFLTHGHADHVYGIGQVLQAFPDAQAVATAGTVAQARIQASDEYRYEFYGKLFPGQIPQPMIPDEMASDTIDLEGSKLRAIEVGHTDTSGTTVAWCPSLRLLVAGDVVYNRTHMYLGETTPASRREWIAVLTRLKDLNPRYVVAGHQQPGSDDSPGDIDESIRYLTDFNDAAAQTTTPTELYEAVLRKHAERANPGSLWGAAKLVNSAHLGTPRST